MAILDSYTTHAKAIRARLAFGEHCELVFRPQLSGDVDVVVRPSTGGIPLVFGLLRIELFAPGADQPVAARESAPLPELSLQHTMPPDAAIDGDWRARVTWIELPPPAGLPVPSPPPRLPLQLAVRYPTDPVYRVEMSVPDLCALNLALLANLTIHLGLPRGYVQLPPALIELATALGADVPTRVDFPVPAYSAEHWPYKVVAFPWDLNTRAPPLTDAVTMTGPAPGFPGGVVQVQYAFEELGPEVIVNLRLFLFATSVNVDLYNLRLTLQLGLAVAGGRFVVQRVVPEVSFDMSPNGELPGSLSEYLADYLQREVRDALAKAIDNELSDTLSRAIHELLRPRGADAPGAIDIVGYQFVGDRFVVRYRNR